VADGQGNPPEVTTGTLALVNVAVGLAHPPEAVVGAVGATLVVQFCPRKVAVAVRPFCGITRLAVLAPPAVFRQSCHGFTGVRFAGTEIPPMVALHPVKLKVAATQIGRAAGGLQLLGAAGVVKVALAEVHDAVTAPTLNVTLVDVAVTAVFAGLTQTWACAMRGPRVITAAIADTTR